MRRSLARISLVVLAGALSGCVTNSTFDLIAADPVFEPKMEASAAPVPTFRIGDVFRYQVGAAEVVETVERIDRDGVWWRDNKGGHWVGNEGALVPTHAVVPNGGKPQLVKAKIQTTGEMFPLILGRSVAFRSTTHNWLNGTVTQEQTCTAEAFGALKVAAGTFDAYRVKCIRNGEVRFNYYAPAVGRVVLQTTDTLFDSVQRELIAFKRGLNKPMRTATGPMEKMPAGKETAKPASLTAGTKMRYGIQLAAYRSPTRVKKAWPWIKRRGGTLLADFKPHYERAKNSNGPLFRLVVGEFPTKGKARQHCQALKRHGVDCWARARAEGIVPGPVAATEPANKFRVVSR